MSGFYRYCVLAHVADAVALGWLDCGALPGNHGRYAGLVFWPHDSAPVWLVEWTR